MIGNANVVALLREEIVAVIAKHFPVEPSSIKVRMETGDTISTLEVEAEIPTPLCANPKRTAEIAVEVAAVQKKKDSRRRRRRLRAAEKAVAERRVGVPA